MAARFEAEGVRDLGGVFDHWSALAQSPRAPPSKTWDKR